MIDLHVYSKNQQFRLYRCVKYEKNNPLVLCSHYLFATQKDHTDVDILHHSLITFSTTKHCLIINLHENGPVKSSGTKSTIENTLIAKHRKSTMKEQLITFNSGLKTIRRIDNSSKPVRNCPPSVENSDLN